MAHLDRCAARLAAVAAFGLAVTVAQEQETRAARQAFMRAHFAAALRLHDAVARGDLRAAAAHARSVADHRPDVPFPTGSVVFFTLMQAAARDVAEAPALEDAARQAAVLLTRCGECHASEHVAPRVLLHLRGTAPAAGPMAGHQEGADLLVSGLVEPASDAWLAGAEAFARLRMPRPAMPGRDTHARALIADVRLSSLAAEAASAVRPPDRARVYGRVLSTCARCHEEHGARPWGPDRR